MPPGHPTPPSYVPSALKPPGPASWPIIRSTVWPGVWTPRHLPLGERFYLNEPRQLSIQVPSYLTGSAVRWEAYTNKVDFCREDQVLALNQWREAMIKRALMDYDALG
jgi:hypothetical protein